MKNIYITTVIAVCIASCGFKKPDTKHINSNDNSRSILGIDYIGKAVQKKDTHVWGSSPVEDGEGKIHLYVAEWPKPHDSEEMFTGWYKHSRISHYVSDEPEGPFSFVREAVQDKDGTFNAPHNPTIQYLEGKYVLCFIVNEDNDVRKQRIVMLVSDDLNDNWRAANGAASDGTMIKAPDDSAVWNYQPRLGVSNPSLIKFGDKFMLYYKSVIPDRNDPDDRNKWDYGYGVALSDKLEGPYTFYPHRVTAEGLQLEDAYAFVFEDKVYMLSRDFRGSLGSQGGGLLWSSDDGYFFSKESVQRSYEDLQEYVDSTTIQNAQVYRGDRSGHLERPQVLFMNGEPSYLYAATGINDNPAFGSCSHVFKISAKD